MIEEQLLARVIRQAAALGILIYHSRDSRRSEPGFPDLVLAGDGGVLFAELKDSAGTLSRDQAAWKWRLLAAGCQWRLWRPEHWPVIIGRDLRTIAARRG